MGTRKTRGRHNAKGTPKNQGGKRCISALEEHFYELSQLLERHVFPSFARRCVFFQGLSHGPSDEEAYVWTLVLNWRLSICLEKIWHHIRRKLATCTLIACFEFPRAQNMLHLYFCYQTCWLGSNAFMLSLLAEGSYVRCHCVFSLERRNELSSFITVWDWQNKLHLI